MPIATTPIANIQDSIDRPVILDVTRQIMDVVRISSKTPIRFLGDEGKAAQMNTLITRDAYKENIWPSDEFVTIEIEAELDKDYAGQIQGVYANQAFTFCDPLIGLAIKPIYAMENVAITFKYSARDRTQAKAWYQRIAALVGNQATVRYHDLSYHYEFSEQLLALIHHCWELRENQGGWGDTFNDYVRAHLSRSATLATDMAGKNSILVIGERQTRVQGWFEFDVFPDKPSKPGDTEVFETSYTYRFMFEKPIDYQVFYPNVVHNQLVNPEYRYKAIKDPETRHKASSFATQSLMYFENDQRAKMLQVGTGLTLPWFDEFGPSSVLPSSVKLLTMLTGITPNNVRDLVNLKTDLEEWEFNPLVMDFLLNSEAPFVGLFFKSIFCLNLYAKNDIVKSGGVELLSSGQVRSTSDLNIRQTYHVRLGIITNLDLLDPEALNRLKKYPEVRDLIIAAIIYALKSCAGDKDIAKNSLSYWDLIRLGVDPDSAYLQAFGKPRPKGPYEKTLDDPVDMDLAQHYLRFMPSLVSTTFIQIKRD